MIGVIDISMRDLACFLYFAKGNYYIRARDGQTYIYNNGALTIFAGLFPESLLSRCPRYAQCAEGAKWCIIKRGGLVGRSDLATMQELAASFAAISVTGESAIGCVETEKEQEKGIDDAAPD